MKSLLSLSMHLYLLRHAEREDGHHFHIHLTEKGHQDAKTSILQAIQDINPTHVYISPFQRTYETILPYFQTLPSHTDFYFDYGLSEFLSPHLGFKGHEASVPIRKEFPISNLYPHHLLQYITETKELLAERCLDFLQNLIKQHFHTNHRVLCVTHKGVISAILRAIDNETPIDAITWPMGHLQQVEFKSFEDRESKE